MSSSKKMTSEPINDKDYNEAAWAVIESYFAGAQLQQAVRHQIESYNNFVQVQIPKTIAMFNPVHIKSEHDYVESVKKYSLEIFVTFDNFSIQRAQIHENNGATKLMFPQEARLRNFTYASNMTVDMNIKYLIRNGPLLESVQTMYKTMAGIHIGKLPIMLNSAICVLQQYKHISTNVSGECSMDPGGYFIINGSEKTCLGQERAAENQVQCFNISKNNSKWHWLAEIKSVPGTYPFEIAYKKAEVASAKVLLSNISDGLQTTTTAMALLHVVCRLEHSQEVLYCQGFRDPCGKSHALRGSKPVGEQLQTHENAKHCLPSL